MEKLAVGLAIICLLYMILFFGLAYWLDGWAGEIKVRGRWHRIKLKLMIRTILRKWMVRFPNDQSGSRPESFFNKGNFSGCRE